MSFIIVFTTIVVLLFVYLKIYRPWQIRWGATDEEVNLSLPGDELVSHPDFNATRAITIHASPEQVWKWIIQIGSKRAGWYSIDWIDNGGLSSSEEILPQFQTIESGQFIPFTPDQMKGMWVKAFEINKYVLWWDKKSSASWLWYLACTNGKTRLLTRLRTKYQWRTVWILYYLVADAFDIIMIRRCLQGIKRRAEQMGHELE